MQRDGLQWLQGYIDVAVDGKHVERMLNQAVYSGLNLWNVRRSGDFEVRFCVSLTDFFKLKPILKATGCRMHVQSRMGVPFHMVNLRRRSGFVLGFLFFVVALYVLSSMIWNVEIQGVKGETAREIRSYVESLGVQRGVFKFRLAEGETIRRAVLQEFPEAAWVGFKIKGTRAIVEIAENVLPEAEKLQSPRHLVAAKKAVVAEIFVEKGIPRVQPNQWVEEGDILVSGILGNEEDYETVVAEGNVKGEVWYKSDVTVPLEMTYAVFTGEKKKRISLLFGEKEWVIWGRGAIEFENYETRRDRYLLHWRDREIALGWKKTTYWAYRTEKRELTESEAVDQGLAHAKNQLLERIDGDPRVKDQKILHQRVENGKVYIQIHFAVIEDIVREKPITNPFQGD